ncbi:MAG TPA: CoA-acylating methylmalonate-semialdehyde dehydrogenase [Solirubrobacterales bacterium]|nr:CoA-acylating methylmalonate-semialdehyde dehydrogenase [Solirubrobacterales bacterium]
MSAVAAKRTIRHRIRGEELTGASSRTAPVWNPATGVQQAEVLLAEPADVDAAVAAARDAFAEWSEASLSRRAKVMFAFRQLLNANVERLARVVSAEHGKVLEDAKGEVLRGLEVVEFACGIPQLLKGEHSDQVSSGVDAWSFRQPLGVCAGITPFNFPAMVPMWMHPLAIACGNAFVLKPSERDPSASNLVADLYAEAGLPDGVFNVVHGDKVAVDALLDHPDVAAISFVGSTPIASYVHARASEKRKRVQALGGAKNHAVVMPGADLDYAADQLAAAGFGSAGQRCMAISVAVAVGESGDRLVEEVARRAREVRVGPGLDPASEMGPVVTAQARDRIVDYIGQGAEAGAQVTVDGRELEVGGGGFWVGPTLIDRVEPGMSVYDDEIFGPVLSVVRSGSLDEAIALINANSYANGAAIFTDSGHEARRFQREVEVGMIGINVPIPVPMAFYSFGGWKDSIFADHHVHGPEGVRFYTRGKAITSRWPASGATDPGDAGSMHFPTSS